MLPTALVCATARQQLSVVLGGDGGDEVFAGYNRHAVGAQLHQLTQHLPLSARRAVARGALATPPSWFDRASKLLPTSRRPPNLGDKAHKVAALLDGTASSWEQLASVWPTQSLGTKPHHGRQLTTTSDEPISELVAVDLATVLPDQMLVKVDRASMAVGLEVRSPLLDPNLLSWSWRQPIGIKAARGTGKLVLREVAREVLPDKISRRPKMGFDPPLGHWLRTGLRPWAEDLLASPRIVERGWLDESALRSAWTEHQNERRNQEYRLWSALMLEMWLAEHHSS